MKNLPPIEEQESTHFIFDGEKFVVSPNITPVVNFLIEIEKEVQNILDFNKKLESITENYIEMLNFVAFLSDKLKENGIDFQYTLKEHPEKITEKLKFHFPLRSQMIVLFASLEVLFTLHLAYENETCDKGVLIKYAMDKEKTRNFLNTFLLTEENEFYKNNKARFCKINAHQLRDLRNLLTHFFSIGHGGLSISPALLEQKSRKFENILKNNNKGNIVFISENDLSELIKDANLLRFKKWSNDFLNTPDDFKRKIQFVIDLVKKHGAVILKNNDININT
jgi:hypothetical protein